MASKKHIGLLGLTMSGIGSMIGSGWLFGAWKAARLAGPAAIYAWPLGALIILLLAITYAELGTRFPSTGGMVRYAQLSHGSFAGFVAGWANWVAILSSIPIEAVSSIQYLASWPYPWAASLYHLQTHELTTNGLLLSAVLIVFYFLLNYWSVKLFLKSMVSLSVFKIAIPLLTCIALFYSAFSHHTFNLDHGNFMPYGFTGVLTAVATAGVVFSFNGFQTPINLSGEAKRPGRNVPLSIFFSMGIAFIIYLLLQFAFIGTISPKYLVNGWKNIQMSSPYVHLAMAFQLNWLVILLYVDAFASPSGTGITYTASTSRMLFALQKNGYMPEFVGVKHPKYLIARGAMWVNLCVSFMFLYLFRGWNTLVAVISVSTIISYVNGPVCAVAMRKWESKVKAPIRVKGLTIISPIAFIAISMVLYWARWPLTGEVILIMLLGLPIYFYYQHKNNWHDFARHFRAGVWLVTYLVVIAFISYIGSQRFGGRGWLNLTESSILIAIVAAGFYVWGLYSSFNFHKNTQNQ